MCRRRSQALGVFPTPHTSPRAPTFSTSTQDRALFARPARVLEDERLDSLMTRADIEHATLMHVCVAEGHTELLRVLVQVAGVNGSVVLNANVCDIISVPVRAL